MYVKGKGHAHIGPGTSMTQLSEPSFGMGCCGMGALFDSGFDFTKWTKYDWAIGGLIGFALWTAFTSFNVARRQLKGRRY